MLRPDPDLPPSPPPSPPLPRCRRCGGPIGVFEPLVYQERPGGVRVRSAVLRLPWRLRTAPPEGTTFLHLACDDLPASGEASLDHPSTRAPDPSGSAPPADDADAVWPASSATSSCT